jgi:hypothetical protein
VKAQSRCLNHKEKSPGASQNKALQYFVRSKQKSKNSRSKRRKGLKAGGKGAEEAKKASKSRKMRARRAGGDNGERRKFAGKTCLKVQKWQGNGRKREKSA